MITNPDDAIKRVIAGEKASEVLKLCKVRQPFTPSDWYQARATLATVVCCDKVRVPNLSEVSNLIEGMHAIAKSERAKELV